MSCEAMSMSMSMSMSMYCMPWRTSEGQTSCVFYVLVGTPMSEAGLTAIKRCDHDTGWRNTCTGVSSPLQMQSS